MIRLVEDCASSELYSLLKRPDEKAVTERAYENPVFVEDLVHRRREAGGGGVFSWVNGPAMEREFKFMISPYHGGVRHLPPYLRKC